MSADGKMSKDELMLMEALIQHPASSRDLATDLRLTFAHIRALESELAAKDAALAEARTILKPFAVEAAKNTKPLHWEFTYIDGVQLGRAEFTFQDLSNAHEWMEKHK